MDNQTLLAEIKKLVLPLQAGQERAEKEFAIIGKRFDHLEQVQNLINTRLGNVEQGQDLINTRLGNVEQGQDQTNKRFDNLEQGLARTNTALEALAEGQKDIREKMATKADLMDLRSDLNKKIKNHEKRITAIEEDLDVHHKN